MTTDDAPEPSTVPERHRHAPETPPRSNVWRILFIVLAAIVLVGVAIAVVFALRGTPGPAPSPTPTPAHSGTPSPTPTQTETPVAAACDTDTATATLGQPDGTAGATHVAIVFTNSGSAECTLEGYPIVVFVGDDNGTQIGSAAADDASTPVASYTLKPGEAAQAMLTITDSGNVDDCDAQAAMDCE